MAVRREEVQVKVTGAVDGARDLDKLGRAVDDVGDELKGTARDASHLDRELNRLERTSRDLNREFARTGDKGLLKQIKETNKELAPLRAVRRELDKIAATDAKSRREADSAAASRLKQMTTPGGGARAGVGGLSLPLSPTTLAVGGTLAAGLAPVIFAGAGGAILAGGAGLGVAGGIAGAAANNPAIGNSAKTALSDEAARWKQASRDFEEPTLRAIATIKAAVDDIPLEEILKNAAEFVGPLAHGVAGLTRAIGEGIGALVEDAGPVVAVLERELPRLGKSFQSMFEEIGEGSEGGAEALQDILQVTSRIIIGTGMVIHFFEELYAAGIKLRKALPGDMWNDDEVSIQGFSQSLGDTAVEFDRVADSAGDANAEVETYEDTLHRLLNIPMELAEANADYQESLDNLTESIKENKRNWDEGTEAGRKNNATLRDAVNAAVAVRDAQVAMGTQTGVANRQLDAEIAKLRAQAVAAGMSAAEFDRLTGALRNYLSVPSVKVVTTRFVTEGSAPRASSPGRQFAFASGGSFTPGYAVVGEDGPELVKFNGSGRVYSNAESKAMATTLGATGRGNGATSMTFAGDTNSWLAQAVMNGIRTGQIVLNVGGQRVSV
jgi:phage host-nuclease inhibitor protein Gam